MKTLARILVLSLAVSGCALRINPASPNIPPIQAVSILTDVLPDGTVRPRCTTWYLMLDGTHGAWLTNAHCVVDERGGPGYDLDFRIGGEPAKLVGGDPVSDLAVLQGPAGAHPLLLATRQSTFGEAITMVGYPAMILSVVKGVIANPAYNEPGTDGVFAEYDMALAGGASGSPVLNEQGRVTGMVSYSRCAPMVGFCARSGGPTLDMIKAFVGKLEIR